MKAMLFAMVAILMSSGSFAHGGNDPCLVFAAGKVHAHLKWLKGPDGNGGESKLRLDWRDGATHAPLDPAMPFSVSLWMPSMGHGSAPTKIRRIVDGQGNAVTGAYEVSNVYFIMPGDWDIRVSLKYADGRVETQAWSLIIEGSGHGGHHHWALRH